MTLLAIIFFICLLKMIVRVLERANLLCDRFESPQVTIPSSVSVLCGK